MKSIRTVLRTLTFCAVGLITGASAWAFEGKINMTMKSGKDSGSLPITYYVKGSKLRMETTVPAGKGEQGAGMTMVMIMDSDAKQFMTLMPEQKMYMVHKLPENTGKNVQEKTPDMQFKPTGRKEKIAGYDTEEYVGVSDGMETEMWVTKGLGRYMMANQGKRGAPGKVSEAEAFLSKEDMFPLRMVMRGKKKKNEEMRMEVTNVDKTPQHDSLFKPPADFTQFSMGGMLKGLIPGQQ